MTELKPTTIDREQAQRLADERAQLVEVLPAAEFDDGRIGRSAIRGREDVLAEEAMTLSPSTIRPSARPQEVVERMRKQKLTGIPVTTSDGRLVGLLRREDAEAALRQLAR